ncbi:hypothetical protein [Scytonema sp. NUACC21]
MLICWWGAIALSHYSPDTVSVVEVRQYQEAIANYGHSSVSPSWLSQNMAISYIYI